VETVMLEIIPIIPEINPDAPSVFFENVGGTHYTLTDVTPIDFGSVEAASFGVLSDIYVDNEASGTPTDDLDTPIIDGIEHPTAQSGDPEDTYKLRSLAIRQRQPDYRSDPRGRQRRH